MTVSQEKTYKSRRHRAEQARQWRTRQAVPLTAKAEELRRRALLTTKAGKALQAERLLQQALCLQAQAVRLRTA